MTREGLKIQMAANYADTIPDYVDGNYVRGLEDGYKKGWDDADSHPKNPWRDAVSDPPKDDSDVFVVFFENTKGCGYYDPDYKEWRVYGWGFVDVKYWMPIPETPKGGKE